MSHLAILLPFGLPPAEISADLFRELKTPALATLLARARFDARASRYQSVDDFQRALPHETWLAREFGLAGGADNSPPLATALMRSIGADLPAEPEGTWFILQPVHIHIARDHLVLTDPRQLMLPESQARALFDIAKPLFEEVGKPLLYGDAATWFMRADDWAALHTATPDAAVGHNIDIWMPKGAGERDWRKLQNEVQMHWFAQDANAEREAQGLKPANSLWLWGGAQAAIARTPHRYTDAFNLSGWTRAFQQFAPRHAQAATAKDAIAAKPQQGLALLDALLEPALSNDWARWIDHMQTLENDWFAPLLAALRGGGIDQVSLIATNDSRIARFTTTRSSLRKFWITPALTPLVP